MATIDFDAIGSGIATRFAPAQVTPPAGLGNVRSSSIDLPNALTLLPRVLVFPDRGELAPGNGSRLATADYLVRFYMSVTKDLPRETNACRKWLPILIDQIRVGETLGLGAPVAVARVNSYRVGILPYQQRDYTGVELGVRVTLSMAWAA
jgi:hypothetical protein